MVKKCPKCESSVGIREAIYGFPAEFPLNEGKYFYAGCTASGGKYVCVLCQWGIEGEDD